jgi:hypothetical protein
VSPAAFGGTEMKRSRWRKDTPKHKRGSTLRRLLPNDEIEALAASSRAVAEANVAPRALKYGPVGLAPEIVEIFKETMNFEPVALPASGDRVPAKLTPRESKLFGVIERGASGRKYCRELDLSRLKPRRSWIDKGCPGRYLKAYEDPHWKQMIHNEKSYITRKARSSALVKSARFAGLQ